MKAGKFPLAYPTADSAALLFVLAAIWYGASSQNSAAIYLLLFLLASVLLVSIPHTLINLSGVTLRVESAKPTFAGDDVSLPVEIMNTSRATRYGIEVLLPDAGRARERVDCIPRENATRLTLRFPARQRGEYKIDTLGLTSCYPLGFVRALKRFVSNQTYLVYPKPAEILSCRQVTYDSQMAWFSKASVPATILPGCAPMCRANPNATSIGKPWRVGNH